MYPFTAPNPITHESSHLTNIKEGKLIDKSLLKWTKRVALRKNELMIALNIILLWYFELEHIKITWVILICNKDKSEEKSSWLGGF